MDADVIIVGAGPAGCTAARICAAAGLDTVLVDRAAFPRDKPCAGGLSPRAVADLTRVFGLDSIPAEFGVPRHCLRAHFYRRPRDGPRPRDGAPAGARRRRPVHEPTWLDYRRLVLDAGHPLVFVTRRATLDQFLLGRAEAAGVKVMTRTEVVTADQGEAGVLVTVRDAGERDTPPRPTLLRPLRARFLIGADGATSIVARSLGRRAREGPVAECLSLFVPLERDHAETLTGGALDFHFGLVRGGYGWAFPAESGLAVGIGALAGASGSDGERRGQPDGAGNGERQNSERGTLPEGLAWLLSVYGLPPRPEGAVPPRGWFVPLGGCRRLWAKGRVLLAGDAAGTANPLTGEGIGPAVASAELAAGVVTEAARREAGGRPAARPARRRFGVARGWVADAGVRLAAALGAGSDSGTAGPGAEAASYDRSLWRRHVAGQRPLLAAARAMAVFSPERHGRFFGRPAFSRLAAMMGAGAVGRGVDSLVNGW